MKAYRGTSSTNGPLAGDCSPIFPSPLTHERPEIREASPASSLPDWHLTGFTRLCSVPFKRPDCSDLGQASLAIALALVPLPGRVSRKPLAKASGCLTSEKNSISFLLLASGG